MPRQNELQLCLYKSQDYVYIYIYKWFCDVLTFFFLVIFYLMLFRSRVAQNRIYIYRYAELRFFIEHFYLLDHEKLFYVSFLSLVSHGNFLSTRSWLYIYLEYMYACLTFCCCKLMCSGVQLWWTGKAAGQGINLRPSQGNSFQSNFLKSKRKNTWLR